MAAACSLTPPRPTTHHQPPRPLRSQTHRAKSQMRGPGSTPASAPTSSSASRAASRRRLLLPTPHHDGGRRLLLVLGGLALAATTAHAWVSSFVPRQVMVWGKRVWFGGGLAGPTDQVLFHAALVFCSSSRQLTSPPPFDAIDTRITPSTDIPHRHAGCPPPRWSHAGAFGCFGGICVVLGMGGPRARAISEGGKTGDAGAFTTVRVCD